MSQHTFAIANEAGAAFRGDVNNALQALASQSSGAAAPGTTYAYQPWLDTTTSTLKRRNAANSAWVVRDTADESFLLGRSSNTILGLSDRSKMIDATASFTQTLSAAATLGDGWWIAYRVEAGFQIVFDPNASENIDGATTKTVNGPASGILYCNGSQFLTVGFDGVAQLQKNFLINGSMAIAQRAMPTADNSYCLDRWRLMLGAANAATVTQDTADVPTGAKYACKLVVGSGINNKFGIFQPIEGVNIYELRGQTVSILVPLKATAGLTDGSGKIRVGILQWTGTEDSISATPISAWNAEGTNPTLIANWAFANTPAAIAVTTSWADYAVLNVSISASAVNLGVLIWSDDKANTQTTDILRVGGYVTFVKGGNVPNPVVAPITKEKADCQRYYEKDGISGVTAPGSANATGYWIPFAVDKRVAPTMVSSQSSLSGCTAGSADTASVRGFRDYVISTGAGACSWVDNWTASAEL